VDPGAGREPARQAPTAKSSCGSCASSTRPRRSRPSCRPSSSARSASRSRAPSRHPAARRDLSERRRAGLDEVAIGMPHRGRLNVLANIVGKKYGQIFREFEGNIGPSTPCRAPATSSTTSAPKASTAGLARADQGLLAANPSHLEAVNPVLEGIARAKQDLLPRPERRLPVLPLSCMHGDAAFAGQGVVAETLQMSPAARLPHRRHDPRGRQQPGRLHHRAEYSRARRLYPTDVARAVRRRSSTSTATTPRRCVRVAELAFDYRQAFHKDVVIDLVCYRRRGHNEGDDPSLHPAEHVRPHRAEALQRPQALHRVADRPRGHLDRGGRGRPQATSRSSSSGCSRGPRGARRTSRPPRAATTRSSRRASELPRPSPAEVTDKAIARSGSVPIVSQLTVPEASPSTPR
jgi:hypothetical protein